METLNNNTNNNNELNELNALREQINAIKDKVDQEGHLNGRLVKQAIQGKMKGMHRTIMVLAVAAMFCIPLYIWMKYEQNLSWALTIVTIVMLVGSVISDYFINRMDVRHMGDDMVDTARKLTQMKRNRSRATRVEIGVVALWLVWFCYEQYLGDLSVMGSHSALMVAIIMFVIIMLVSALIGYPIYRKMQRATDEMIDQINELTSEQ